MSPRTLELIDRIEEAEVRQKVSDLFATKAALFGRPIPQVLDRVHFSVIKLAMEGQFEIAEALYRVDTRDLLVNAEFADDVQAHEKWAGSLLENK